MARFDITAIRIILAGAGGILVIAELILLVDGILHGTVGGFPLWLRGLVLVGGLLVILVALAARGKER